MKYAGTINIVNDVGDSVYERELTADEMIECFINAAANPVLEDVVPEQEPEIVSGYGKRAIVHACCGSKGYKHKKDCTSVAKHGTVPSAFKEGPRNATKTAPIPGCSECGSKGWTHKKDCPEDATPPPYKGEAKGVKLNEEQFDLVKDARENDFKFTALKCADEMGVDMLEVNRAVLTETYEKYLTSYSLQA